MQLTVQVAFQGLATAPRVGSRLVATVTWNLPTPDGDFSLHRRCPHNKDRKTEKGRKKSARAYRRQQKTTYIQIYVRYVALKENIIVSITSNGCLLFIIIYCLLLLFIIIIIIITIWMLLDASAATTVGGQK